MLYVLMEGDYDDVNVVGVYEGPEGLDVDKLAASFNEQFNEVGLGRIEYLLCTAPDAPKIPNGLTALSGFVLCSGVVVSGMSSNQGHRPNTRSPEYMKWMDQCSVIRQEWYARKEAKIKEYASKYPGDTLQAMFLSLLKQDYHFKEVSYKTAFI